MNARIAAVAAATAATAALTLALAPTASADDRTITTLPDAYYGTPQSGTGGLILRERDGSPTDSGIAEGTRFEISETCYTAYGMQLLKVQQIGSGGWGSRYSGYVRRDFANVPPSLPC